MTNNKEPTKKDLINEIIIHELISTYDAYDYQTDDQKEISYITCNLCLFSDYVGDIVTRSNQRELFELFKDKLGVQEYAIGYSGVQTTFNYESLTKWKKEDLTELLDLLNGLQSYPCINDEDLSFLEDEIFNETWINYISSDIISDLQKILSQKADNAFTDQEIDHLFNLSNDLDIDNYIYEYNKEVYRLLDLYWTYTDKTNDYPIYETATSAYVDTKKVSKWIYENTIIIHKPITQKDITDYI